MTFKFDEVVKLNGQPMTRAYIGSLNLQQRLDIVDDLVKLFRNNGWQYPDNISQVDKEYKRLINCKPDTSSIEIYNNSSVGTYICKYFCKSFYSAKNHKDAPTMEEIFNNDDLLKKIIINRLGCGWYDSEPKETFNLSPKMVQIQACRSMRISKAGQITLFKPDVAKYLSLRYSNENDTIFDYSCGFGARMLGAAASNRKYIGTDPLTIPELTNMKEYLKLSNITLIQSGSECYTGDKNSIDFSYSSPPYFNQERWSDDKSQAYNNGEDYFYNIYWTNTLKNIKHMLKPNKWFGLNVINYPKMVEIAKEYFGEPDHIVKLKTVRSHLNKTDSSNAVKFEPIYLFKNIK